MGNSRKRKDSEYEKEIKDLNAFIEKGIVDGDGLRKDLENISLCPYCYCMTHTIKKLQQCGCYAEICGKCKKEKK